MGNEYNEALKLISKDSSFLKILNAELSLPNIKAPTMGGNVFWTTLAEYSGWRLQQNDFTRHARILDPDNMRVAWGTPAGMYKALDRLVQSMKGDCYNNAEDSSKAMESLKKLKELLDIGAINQNEYEAKKSELMKKI